MNGTFLQTEKRNTIDPESRIDQNDPDQQYLYSLPQRLSTRIKMVEIKIHKFKDMNLEGATIISQHDSGALPDLEPRTRPDRGDRFS